MFIESLMLIEKVILSNPCFLQKQILIFNYFYTSSRQYSSSINKTDHYKTLGVPPNSSAKEIKAAFYKLSKKYHPDVNDKSIVEKNSELFQNVIFVFSFFLNI